MLRNSHHKSLKQLLKFLILFFQLSKIQRYVAYNDRKQKINKFEKQFSAFWMYPRLTTNKLIDCQTWWSCEVCQSFFKKIINQKWAETLCSAPIKVHWRHHTAPAVSGVICADWGEARRREGEKFWMESSCESPARINTNYRRRKSTCVWWSWSKWRLMRSGASQVFVNVCMCVCIALEVCMVSLSLIFWYLNF